MRRRAGIAVLLSLAAAGCGGGSDVHRLRSWSIPADLFLADVGRAPVAHGHPIAPRPASAPPAGISDAEVRAELRALNGGHVPAGRAISLAGNGTAQAPPDAPPKVQAIVTAANSVARLPYVYGGGHGRGGPEGTFVDSAYDCSGSVSFALASAGLVKSPMDSTTLSHWGRPGPGRWVTIFANAGHAFMIVGGVRFDTVGLKQSGSRWQPAYRSISGFTARHPPGL